MNTRTHTATDTTLVVLITQLTLFTTPSYYFEPMDAHATETEAGRTPSIQPWTLLELVHDMKKLVHTPPAIYSYNGHTVGPFREILDTFYPSILRALACCHAVHVAHTLGHIRHLSRESNLMPEDIVALVEEKRISRDTLGGGLLAPHGCGQHIVELYNKIVHILTTQRADTNTAEQIARVMNEMSRTYHTLEMAAEINVIRDLILKGANTNNRQSTTYATSGYTSPFKVPLYPVVRYKTPLPAPATLKYADGTHKPMSQLHPAVFSVGTSPFTPLGGVHPIHNDSEPTTSGHKRHAPEDDTDEPVARNTRMRVSDNDAVIGFTLRRAEQHDERPEHNRFTAVLAPYIPRTRRETDELLHGVDFGWYARRAILPKDPHRPAHHGFDYGTPMDTRACASNSWAAGVMEYIARGSDTEFDRIVEVYAPNPEEPPTAIWSILGGTTYLPWKRMTAYFHVIGCGELTRSRFPQLCEARPYCGCPSEVHSRAVTRGLSRTTRGVRHGEAGSNVLPFSRGRPIVTDAFMFALNHGYSQVVHPLIQFALSITQVEQSTSPCTSLGLTTQVDPVTMHMTVCARGDVHIGAIIRKMRVSTYAAWSDSQLAQQLITMRTTKKIRSSAIRELAGVMLAHIALVMSPLVETHHAHTSSDAVECPRCHTTPPVGHRDMSRIVASSPANIDALFEGIRNHTYITDAFTRAIEPLFTTDEPHTLERTPSCATKRYAIACMWAFINDLALLALIRAQHPNDPRDRVVPKIDNMARVFTIFALKLSGRRTVPSFADHTIDDIVNGVMCGAIECATAIAMTNVNRVRVFSDAIQHVDARQAATLHINTRVSTSDEDESQHRQARIVMLRGASEHPHDWVGGVTSNTRRTTP